MPLHATYEAHFKSLSNHESEEVVIDDRQRPPAVEDWDFSTIPANSSNRGFCALAGKRNVHMPTESWQSPEALAPKRVHRANGYSMAKFGPLPSDVEADRTLTIKRHITCLLKTV